MPDGGGLRKAILAMVNIDTIDDRLFHSVHKPLTLAQAFAALPALRLLAQGVPFLPYKRKPGREFKRS